VAKESVLVALSDVAVYGGGTGIDPAAGWVLVAGVTLGSALTVAYTARFLHGAFATKPGVEPCPPRRLSGGFLAAPAALAATSLAAGFAGAFLTDLWSPYGEQYPAGAHEPKLTLWHGLGPALWLSLFSLVAGAALFAARQRVQTFQSRVAVPRGAQDVYQQSVRGLDRGAVEVTARAQRGSLPIYLGVILTLVIVLPGGAAVLGLRAEGVRWTWWDTPAQAAVGTVIAIAAVLTVRSRRRLRAVILMGVTGYGIALLFQLHGAPDLALTQVLVETLTLVVFVLVLRRLPGLFTDRPLQRSRYWRVAIGTGFGAVTAAIALLAASARTAPPVSLTFGREAVEYGGGSNIVNVTLVDIRAWDTMGELAVLVAAATGVASLVFIRTRGGTLHRVSDAARAAPPGHPLRTRSATWLTAGRTMAPERRSIVIEVVTRLLFHTMVLLGLFLLFSGHNNPGGGFAAGLVTGLALVVRYLAGGRHELDEAAPVDAGALIGTGLAIATGSALAPVLLGGSVLQSAVMDIAVPVLGEVHLVTSLGFDIGVFLVVVGLVLDVMRCLGSEIDEHLVQERDQQLRAREPEAARETQTAMGGGS
jgi:multicomponent Na+:H+ antiporter subunit A